MPVLSASLKINICSAVPVLCASLKQLFGSTGQRQGPVRTDAIFQAPKGMARIRADPLGRKQILAPLAAFNASPRVFSVMFPRRRPCAARKKLKICFRQLSDQIKIFPRHISTKSSLRESEPRELTRTDAKNRCSIDDLRRRGKHSWLRHCQ